MHVVKLPSFHRDTGRAKEYVRYISHREEDLPAGHRRELYGIGERYKDVGGLIADPGDRERAFKRLIEQDAMRFPRYGRNRGGPIFHRPIFTVNERAARVFAAMPRPLADRAVRDMFQKALRSSAIGRQVQGVYAVHWHGGYGRAAHPHIHTLLSPARTNGRPNYIGPRQLASLKAGWNRSVERTVVRLTKMHFRQPAKDLDQMFRIARGVAAVIAHPVRGPLSAAVRAIAEPSLKAGSLPLPVQAVSLVVSFTRSPVKTAAVAALNIALSRVPVLGLALRAGQTLDLVRSRNR
jgi:hypothetical protein